MVFTGEKIWHQNTSGNFLFLATLVGAYSELTLVSSVRCSGGGLLGPAEGSVTVLYPGGKLKLCYLAGDQVVQGVPCASGGLWKATVGHDQAVEFYENGKLKSCRLSQDFGNHKRGDAFLQLP
jgi:hypothetical protein